jgi:hypothetical protein
MTAHVIKMSIQRMVCTACGAEANASCNCGVAYQPKSIRATEAVKANPEKSDRAIAKEIGASPTTVGKAREQLSTTGQLEDTSRVGLDGKMRKVPEKKSEPKTETKDDSFWNEYLEGLTRIRKLEARNSALSEALAAKEAQASRDWPANMTPKQLRRRDNCLKQIAGWQRDLEELYGEVTGQPSWRVEVITKDGKRLGTGARFGTRGEAELYNTHFAPSELQDIYATGKVIPCNDKPNVQINGDLLRFAHGDCVLLAWRPVVDVATKDGQL